MCYLTHNPVSLSDHIYWRINSIVTYFLTDHSYKQAIYPCWKTRLSWCSGFLGGNYGYHAASAKMRYLCLGYFTCQHVVYCFVRVINVSAVFKQYTPGHLGRSSVFQVVILETRRPGVIYQNRLCARSKTRSDWRKAVTGYYFQSSKSTIKRHIFYKWVLKTTTRTVVLCFRLNHCITMLYW